MHTILKRAVSRKLVLGAGTTLAVLTAQAAAFGADDVTTVEPAPGEPVVVQPSGAEPVVVQPSGAEPVMTEPTADTVTEEPSDGREPGEELIFLKAAGGYAVFDSETFEDTSGELTAGLISDDADGPTVSVGAGVKLLFVTLGITGSFADLHGSSGLDTDYTLWTLDGEVGLKLFPVGRLQPYLLLGGGYTALGGFGDAIDEIGDSLTVDGLNARAGVGLDFYASPLFSIGAQALGEVYFLKRDGRTVPDTAATGPGALSDADRIALASDGTTAGAGLRFMADAGLHF